MSKILTANEAKLRTLMANSNITSIMDEIKKSADEGSTMACIYTRISNYDIKELEKLGYVITEAVDCQIVHW